MPMTLKSEISGIDSKYSCLINSIDDFHAFKAKLRKKAFFGHCYVLLNFANTGYHSFGYLIQ